jgi:hypothetical protein
VLGLAPVGIQARQAHDALISQVLRSGTQISLRVRSPHPAPREYLIQRTIPNQAVVKGDGGELLDLKPAEAVPHLEVFGQHEISELARDPEQRTRLLSRFLDAGDGRESLPVAALEATREALLTALASTSKLKERLAALPSVLETLKRYEEAGLEDKLKYKSQLVREEHLLDQAVERLATIESLVRQLEESLPIDHEIVDAAEQDALPNGPLLSDAQRVLSDLSQEASKAAESLRAAFAKSEGELQRIRERWDIKSQASDADYERTLRELHREQIDGAEFIRLRRRIEQLEPIKGQLRDAETTLKRASRARETALVAFEDAKAAEFRALERAAKQVSRDLRGRVRVTVAFQGNREPLVRSSPCSQLV